jgi:hypothetical protein
MMKRLGRMIDVLIYEHVALAWLPSLAILIVIALCPSVRRLLPLQISGSQTTLYATAATMSTTLLGFSIAVVALFAGLPEHAMIKKVRTQGLLERAVRQVGRACFAVSLAIGASVAGLILDQPPAQAAPNGMALGTGSYWIWMIVVTAIPSVVLLGLSTATVIKMVTFATKDGPR